MRAGRARPLEALARSGWALAAWVGLATVAAPGLLGLGHDNSPEVFFVRDDTALADYRSFTSRFSDFGALRVVAEGPGLWTREGLAWLGRVERRAPGVRGVVAASGPSGAHPSETGGWPPADPLAERDRLAAEPLARDMGWIASGGEAASLLLAVRRLAPGERRRLLAELDDLLADRPPEVEARVVGIAAVNRALDRAVGATLAILFPLVVALGAAAIALALRSGRDTALPLLVAALTQTVIFGTMGHLGVAFSIVTSILPLLLFVLALATVLHLLLAVREERRAGLAPEAAVAAAYRRKAWPVLWTGLTTGIGFGSLAISDSPPVRALGLWAAFGIAVLLAAAFTLCPALLARSRPPRPAPRTPFERRGRRLGATAAGLATRRPAAVHLLFLLTLLGALAGVPRLEVETGVLEYFRPGHPARAGLEALEAKGVGAVSAELLITLPGGSFESAAAGGRLGRLGDRLRAAPSALGVVTAADLPSADPELARRARPLLLADGGATTRVVIFLPFAGFTRLEPLFAEARAAAAAAFPEATVTLTG
ncbi:MAG: MMPL family transporter, partial [Thermoanaerobaculia bacterium]|nr:MMPL family transporter [Thermoanaerobaculia bacterium]